MEHPHEKTLHAYVDKALDAPGEEAVRAHLSRCPRCRREVNELGRLFDELKNLPAPCTNKGMVTRILKARERQEREAPLSFDLFGLLFGRIGWVVVAVGLLAGVLMGHAALTGWRANFAEMETAYAMADPADSYLGYLISDKGDIL